MLTTIQGRMLLIFAAFLVLLSGVVAASFQVLQTQKDDGLIVNLAGRQRMLTQRMTKEGVQLANAAAAGREEQVSEYRDVLRHTMRVFESTLFALRDGGSAPTNLDMTKMRQTPPAATEEIRKQLDIVEGKWSAFKTHLNAVLASHGKSTPDVDAIMDTNLQLLEAMDGAVSLMQADSESKVATLYVVQGVALFLGLVLVALGGWLARATIARPIQELAEAARVMSTGNLNVQFRSQGTQEVRDLSESFDRMRVSMIASLDGSMSGAMAANDDL
ncbi:MAG: type IV pili methyl-accepting chemotaxis transducer N-terminal domain-containing protein [Myxococcales bacterium]